MNGLALALIPLPLPLECWGTSMARLLILRCGFVFVFLSRLVFTVEASARF